MPARRKKKVDVEVKATEPPVAEEVVKEEDKPILVAEAEAETEAVTPVSDPVPDSSQIFGPTAAEPPQTNKGLFWILIIVFTVLGAVAGGAGIYLQTRSSSSAHPAPSPETTATPTPTPQLNRKDLQIQVLNGSGVTGQAKIAQDYLTGLGYTVVAIGNADTSDFPTTVVAIKDAKKGYFSQLKQDLASKYAVADNPDSLAADSKYDAVITLGKE